MKKKLLSGVMAVMMVASIMTGCGDAKKDVSANADSDTKVEAVATTETDEGVSEETTEQEVEEVEEVETETGTLPESIASREEIQQVLLQRLELVGYKDANLVDSEFYDKIKWNKLICLFDAANDNEESGFYSDDGKRLSEVEPYVTTDVLVIGCLNSENSNVKNKNWEVIDKNGEQWDKITVTFTDDSNLDKTVEIVLSPTLDEAEVNGIHYTYIFR